MYSCKAEIRKKKKKMKLLSWMHRKVKTDAPSSFKGSTTGLKSSLDNQAVHVTTIKNSTLKWQPQDCHHFNDFTAENYEELDTRENDEIFPGFLTIGTLSMGPITESPTPTFGLPSQETDEDEIADIKYELNLISNALEKFLKDEMEGGKNELMIKECQETNITFSDEVKEEVSSEFSVEVQLHPLQGYLLGSSTEKCNPREKQEKGKTSLHGLFKRGKMLKRSSSKEDQESDKKAAKENKLSNRRMNKMQQTPPSYAAKPSMTGTKLNKIKRMFQKKIHPEISTDGEEDNDFSKYDNGRIINKSRSAFRKSNKIGCWTTLTDVKKHCSKTEMMLPSDAITKINLDLPTKDVVDCAGKEHWINTDDEYFVLEL